MIEVRGSLELSGVRDEAFRVLAGGVLVLHGRLRGSVTVLTEGQAWLLGGLEGHAVNEGGHLVVVGATPGNVVTRAGKTRELPAKDTVALTLRGDRLVEVQRPNITACWRATSR